MTRRSGFDPACHAFLLGFAFAFFFQQGLPFTFGDDLNFTYEASRISWATILRGVFNPFTPGWYVHGVEAILTNRVFQTAIYKLIHQLAGLNPVVFRVFKAAMLAATGTLIFRFVLYLTQSRAVGFASAIFFFTLPPVFRSTVWIADPEILVQFSILVSLFLFLEVYEGKYGNGRLAVLVALSAFLSAWLGMKIKETARIVPFLLLAFLALRHHRDFFRWIKADRKNWALLGGSLILLLPVIPLSPQRIALDERSHTAIFHFKFSNLLIVLRETTLLLIVLFVLLLLGCFILLGRRPSLTGNTERSFPILPSGLLLVVLWTGLSAAGFAMNFHLEGNLRYLTTFLTPLTVLIFSIYGWVSRFWSAKVVKLFHSIFGIALILIVQRNIDEIIFIRNFDLGFEVAEHLFIKKIYEDRYGVHEPSWQQLDNFYRGIAPAKPIELNEIRIKEWDDNVRDQTKVENLERVASKWGAAYVLSFNEGLYADEPHVQLLHQTTTATPSLYSVLLSRIKKKVHRKIYLYKFSPA